MNEKFHVPFDTAILLRKKGYNNKVDYYYLPNGEICLAVITEVSNDTLDYENNGTIAAPTYHEVVDWLQGKGITIEVNRYYAISIGQYGWKSYSWKSYTQGSKCIRELVKIVMTTREEALNEAIIAALEML